MLLRASTADQRLKPVENLATNPSFERVLAGTTIVRRNLATYPQAQGAGAGIAGWSMRGSGANSSSVRLSNQSDGPLPQITNYIRRSFTAAQSVNDGGFDNSQYPAPLAVTIGRTYTYSAWLRVSVTGIRLRLRVQNMTGPNTGVSLVQSLMLPSSVANQWTRLSITFTATHPFVQLIATSENGGPVNAFEVGDTIDGTGLLLEERPALLPYFDGSTTDTSGISYSWQGATGGSMSIARAAGVEVRRNLKVIPAIGSGHGVSIPSSSPTSTITTDTPVGTSQYWRMTHDGSGANIGFDSHSAHDPVISTTAVAYNFSAWVRLSRAGTITVTPINAASNGATNITNPSVAIEANIWTRVGFTATINNAGSLGLRLRSNSVTYQSGDTLDVGALLVEAGPIIRPYFDGTMTPDADLSPAWTGADNASVSVLFGTGIADTAGYRIRSWEWSLSGVSSMRIPTLQTAGVDSFASPGSDAGAMRLGMIPGRTYTASATIRLSQAQGGTPSPTYARRVVAYGRIDGLYAPIATSAAAPNTPGVTTLRLTFTLPLNTTEAFIRLYNGAARNMGDVYWDDFTLIEGAYSGPYLDGDTPGATWRGTPHGSASIGYPPSV